MKAMMGSTTDARTLELLDEIRVLRARVAELEDALAAAESLRRQDEDADARRGLEVQAVLEASAAAR
jgi:hypothetical protein